MPQVSSIEGLVSFRAKQRLGFRYAYGCAVFGESMFGDDGLFGWIYGFGRGLFGDLAFGSDDELSGIYHTGHWNGRTHTERLGFYWPHNTQSPAQQAHRAEYTAAYIAWRALTSEEKAVYNQNAIGRHMSGYNLFIKKYLLS